MADPQPDTGIRDSRLEALAEFAAGAGHEINNPLATILGRAELLQRRIDRVVPSGEAVEARRDLAIIAGQAQRIRDMIGDLMLFARPPAPKLVRCNVADEVGESISALRSLAESRGVQIDWPALGPAFASADAVQLRVLIKELLRNAIEASSAGSGIRCAVTTEFLDGRPFIRIRVEDQGAGLTPSDLEHQFDPFYSGRQAGRGLGFGLCKCWRIVKLHGGEITVVPGEHRGVVATVDLPAGD